jgi:hypothetical protein
MAGREFYGRGAKAVTLLSASPLPWIVPHGRAALITLQQSSPLRLHDAHQALRGPNQGRWENGNCRTGKRCKHRHPLRGLRV